MESKNVVWLLAAIAVALPVRGETWKLAASNAQNVDPAEDASKWTSLSSRQPGPSGVPIGSTDDYCIQGGVQYRMMAWTFPGASLEVGDVGSSVYNSRLYPEGSPVSFNRLILSRGYMQCGVSPDVRGPVEVHSPVDAPFGLFGAQSNRRLTFLGAVSGAEGTGIILGGTWDPGEWVTGNRNFEARFENLDGYYGKIKALCKDPAQTSGYGTSVMLGTTTCPGEIEVMPGSQCGTIRATDEASVSKLTLHEGAWLSLPYDDQVGVNGKLNVTDVFSRGDAPISIFLENAQTIPAGRKIRLISVPQSSGMTEKDFTLTCRKGSAVAGALTVEADEAKGILTLYAAFYPVVTLDKGDTSSATDYEAPTALDNRDAWSDGELPHANAIYTMTSKYLRSHVGNDVDDVFAGEQLCFRTYTCQLLLFCRSFFARMIDVAASAPSIVTGSQSSPTLLGGLNIHGGVTLNLTSYNWTRFTVASEISGPGDIRITGQIGTSSPMATTVLAGTNTSWTGAISVEQGTQASVGTPNFENKHQTLEFSDPRNLGGRLDEFNYRALRLTAYCKLSPSAPVRLDDEVNRGIFIDGNGQFAIGDGCDLDVHWPLTVDGTVWKRESGTLGLGGEPKFISSGGTLTETPPEAVERRLLVITNGYVKALSSGCVNGLTVSMPGGDTTGLKIDFTTSDADLAGLGFFNVKTSEPFAGGKLRIVLENVTEDSIGGDSRKVGLVTVRTEVADDVRRRLAVVAPRVSGYRRRLVREDDARSGHTTFLEKYERAGFKVIIR